MDGIGAEVGQKMRSAIKAKLLELSCYVDDELPDYIMVMVANKRTKSQMNEDLNLFLSTKTSTFVDWLHIVLKKLKEVTVTNAELYKKATKRKTVDVPDVKIKKERKDLILDKDKNSDIEIEENNSLEDSPPIQLSGQRKITVVNESCTNNNDVFDIPLLSQVNNISSEQDLQNIEKKIRSVKSRLGLMVDSDIEEELPEIKAEKDEHRNNQQKVTYRTVQIHNNEDDQSSSRKEEKDETETENSPKTVTANNVRLESKMERKRIIFEEESPPKKVSILERLGTRPADSLTTKPAKTRISLSEFRKEEEPFLKYFSHNKNEERERDRRRRYDRMSERSRRENNTRMISPEGRRRDKSRERHRDRSSDRRSSTRKESVLSRLGVMSKVSVPPKEPEEPEFENELKTREVRSMVQVKPRVIPSGTSQPNKNLLLKAVAEAQRSIAQAPYVGSHLKANSFSSDIVREPEKHVEEVLPNVRKFSQKEKNKLKNLLLSHATQDKTGYSDTDKTEEYIPKPIKETPKETPKYIPSSRLPEDDDIENHQQFIVTLDGIEKKLTSPESRPSVKDRLDGKISTPPKPSVKSRLDSKKSPSPIIFDKIATKVSTKIDVPDRLPIVHPPLSVKNKERCKYWPSCRQGDKCEFIHPVGLCEKFPHCKFGDKCLFVHPTCKFGSSCTKRDCPYNHINAVKLGSRPVPKAPIGLVPSGLQLCKFFPNCANSSCQFYHPKPCKYGKYCKNQSECNFSHHFISNKSSLIWRSK